MDFDKRELIDKFIDEQGIVVEFPGTIDDELLAMMKFAQTCLEDAEKAEADNARLRDSLWTVGHEASRLREAMEAVSAWLFKQSWEDETYTEIYRQVTQALERKP